jgi:hypothetical protein
VDRKTRARRACTASILIVFAGACREKLPAPTSVAVAAAENAEHGMVPATVRDAALTRARVWIEPSTPIASANFAVNPPGSDSFDPTADLNCTFTPRKIGGTTPKFYCTLASGETLKVKYGEPNGEIPAEIAATRLLAALGFPTDRMYRVHSVRCLGCPILPQQALQCLDKGGPSVLCMEGATATHVQTFDQAAIERPFDGRRIEASDDQGWSWFELDKIDPAAGGAPRAHVDAFRLVAVLLAHWDNKAGNQRLVCPAGKDGPDGACAAPLAMIQDLGSTFGPKKMDLHNWKAAPMWVDARSCRVSMATLPFAGATFTDHQISEEGRQFALKLLRQLSREQLDTLFESAGVSAFNHVLAEAHVARNWTDAFLAKVDQIAAGGPCP